MGELPSASSGTLSRAWREVGGRRLAKGINLGVAGKGSPGLFRLPLSSPQARFPHRHDTAAGRGGGGGHDATRRRFPVFGVRSPCRFFLVLRGFYAVLRLARPRALLQWTVASGLFGGVFDLTLCRVCLSLCNLRFSSSSWVIRRCSFGERVDRCGRFCVM